MLSIHRFFLRAGALLLGAVGASAALQGAPGTPGTSVVFNDTGGVNPMRYLEVQSANIGQDWITRTILDPTNPAGPEIYGAVIRFGTPGFPFPTGVNLSFLVNGSRLIVGGKALHFHVPPSSGTATFTLPIPNDPLLVGRTFHSQSFGYLSVSPFQLQALNGLSTTIGML